MILALDSDLIEAAPGHLRHARHFAARRNPVRARMSRVYAAEPIPTLIGGAADHRFAAGPAEMHAIFAGLAAAFVDGASPDGAPPWLQTAIADLRTAGPHALIHGGPSLPAEAHALIHRINERLGARGTTFDLIEPVAHRWDDGAQSMAALIDDMQAGRVTTSADPGRQSGLCREGLPRRAGPRPVHPVDVAGTGRDGARRRLVRAGRALVRDVG